MPRRKALDNTNVDALAYRPDMASKAKRDRGWERQQRADPETTQVAYRGIPRRLNARMKEIAAEHEITVSCVARLFLEYACDDYDAGLLEIVN
jgi:hypothetical protein